MKINYNLFTAALTGGNRVIFEIANGLAERGHEVTVTTLGPRRNLWWMKPKAKVNFIEKFVYLRKLSEEILDRIPGSISKDLNKRILLKKIKDLENLTPECDINVATYCFSAFSVAQSGKGVPFYHMQHFEPLFFSDPDLSRMAEETYHLPINKIANCIWLKDKLQKKYGFRDVPVINPAIDHKVFYPRKRKQNKGKLRIVSLGKPGSWKGLKDLFDAMKLVFEKRKDVELVLFEKKKWSYTMATVPFKFVYAPVNDKLAELYSNCDVLVTPSWYESFPLPPLEAMACGLPVITTRFGTEDYAFDSKNALVVPPKDPNAMASAILRLLEDKKLRGRLSEEGIKTAKQFTWEKTVDKIERLFFSALEKR